MQPFTLQKLDLKKTFKAKDGNGISEDHRKTIAMGLSQVLADSYTMMLKIHNYHWNVTGSKFYSIHKLTEEQYTEVFEAIDEIAERIRTLGFLTPGTFSDFAQLTTIKDGNMELEENAMIIDLAESHLTLAMTAKAVALKADDFHDLATADLLTKRIEQHEKYAWLLRSLLDGQPKRKSGK